MKREIYLLQVHSMILQSIRYIIVEIPLNFPVKNALNVIPIAHITHCITSSVIPIFECSPSNSRKGV